MAPIRGAYVTNNAANDVTVINTAADTFVTTVGTGNTPRGICVLPNNLRVFVANFAPGTVSVIDTATDTLIGGPVTVGANPFLLKPSPDSSNVWCPNSNGTTVSVIDAVGLTVVGTIAGLSLPQACAVQPNNAVVWVANTGAGSMNPYSTTPPYTATHAPVVVGALADLLFECAVRPDGSEVWVCAQGTNKVFIVNTSTYAITTILTGAGTRPTGIAFRPDGKFAYVTLSGTNNLAAIDTTTHAISTFAVGTGPQGIQFLSDGSKGYVLNNVAQTVTVFNPNPFTFISTLATGPFMFAGPQWVAIAPSPQFPGAQFIPKLWLPQKGKLDDEYTEQELRDNWEVIELWAQQWQPPAPVTLLLPHKDTRTENQVNANWVTLEAWSHLLRDLGAPYSPLFIPRKLTMEPRELDVDFLAIQNWANRLPL